MGDSEKKKADLYGGSGSVKRSAFISPVSHGDLFQHGRACVSFPIARDGRSPNKKQKFKK